MYYVSKQATGDTEDIHTARIHNKFTKYNASKKLLFDKYEETRSREHRKS